MALPLIIIAFAFTGLCLFYINDNNNDSRDVGATIHTLPVMKVDNGRVIPRNSNNDIGTSTTVYYGDGSNYCIPCYLLYR